MMKRAASKDVRLCLWVILAGPPDPQDRLSTPGRGRGGRYLRKPGHHHHHHHPHHHHHHTQLIFEAKWYWFTLNCQLHFGLGPLSTMLMTWQGFIKNGTNVRSEPTTHTHSVRGCVVITWDLTNDSSCTTCATEVTALEYVRPENGLRKVAEKGRATSLLLLENQLLACFPLMLSALPAFTGYTAGRLPG